MVRKSDYEDEHGNVDYDAYEDARADYGDMKYQERKDDQLLKELEEKDTNDKTGETTKD